MEYSVKGMSGSYPFPCLAHRAVARAQGSSRSSTPHSRKALGGCRSEKASNGAGIAKYTKSVYFGAMKNLTITLDEETARLARIRAAERDMSLSRFIGEALRRELRHADDYEAAYRAWRARKPFPLKGSPQPYPKREELYDRPVLRRR